MCNHCVIQSVKDRMLNRRTMLKVRLSGTAAFSTGLAAAGAAQAQQSEDPSAPKRLDDIIDLTHTLPPEFPTFGGAPGIAYDQQFNMKEHGFNLFQLTIDEHTATHIDAPLHFSEDGKSVNEIEPADLVAPLAVIDIR